MSTSSPANSPFPTVAPANTAFPLASKITGVAVSSESLGSNAPVTDTTVKSYFWSTPPDEFPFR